jgi:hypothetical protein
MNLTVREAIAVLITFVFELHLTEILQIFFGGKDNVSSKELETIMLL